MVRRRGDLLVRDLPWPGNGVLAHLPGGLHLERPARASPLWIEVPGREEVALRIDLVHALGEVVATGAAQVALCGDVERDRADRAGAADHRVHVLEDGVFEIGTEPGHAGMLADRAGCPKHGQRYP